MCNNSDIKIVFGVQDCIVLDQTQLSYFSIRMYLLVWLVSPIFKALTLHIPVGSFLVHFFVTLIIRKGLGKS